MKNGEEVMVTEQDRKMSGLVVNASLVGATLGSVEAIWLLFQLASLSAREAAFVLLYGYAGYGLACAVVAVCVGLVRRALSPVETASHVGATRDAVAIGVATVVAVQLVSALVSMGQVEMAWLIPGCVFSGLAAGVAARWLVSRLRLLRSRPTWSILNASVLVIGLIAVGTTGERGPIKWYVTVVLATAFAGALVWAVRAGAGRSRKFGAVSSAGLLVAIALLPTLVAGLDHLRTVSVKPAGTPPNVLLISADTLRADRLGCYGFEHASTPHIDALAQQSVLFEEASSVIPLTGPSHTTMLTGLYPSRHGAYTNGVPINLNVVTLPELLSHAGYRTAAFLSGWSLKNAATGLADRFDRYDEDFSEWSMLPDPVLELALLRLTVDSFAVLGREIQQSERVGGRTTKRILEWLSRNHDRPFFVFVHYFDAHAPYSPPAPYDTMHDPGYEGEASVFDYHLPLPVWRRIVRNPRDSEHFKSLYDGEISYLDAEVGRLLDGLDVLGLGENTLVIFTSDHGESLTEHDFYFDHGEFLYQTCMHVPLIVRFPDRRLAGTRIREQVRLIDLAPTVLDVVGIENRLEMDGASLLPVMDGSEPREPRVSFGSIHVGEGNGRAGGKFGWILAAKADNVRARYFIRDGGYKLIWNFDRREGLSDRPASEELYDLERDPGERKNLISNAPPIVGRLRDQLERWRQEQKGGPTRPAPNEDVKERLRALGYL